MEARTQASVALFKLGAHSATLRPEFGGPEKFKVLLRKRGNRGRVIASARVEPLCAVLTHTPRQPRKARDTHS